jgi:hypothetical protein
MSALAITYVNVISTTGENRRPHSGEALFSDGKMYEWMRLPEGKLRFFTNRKTHNGTANSLISFASPKRAALVEAHLEL